MDVTEQEGSTEGAEETTAETPGTKLEAKYGHVLGPLREKFRGRIHAFDLEEYGYPEHGLVVVAKPENPETYRIYTRELRDDKLDDITTIEKFAMACIAYPAENKAKRAIFNDLPAFAQVVASQGERLYGIAIREVGKA
jgi:hypothetical protein